MNLTTRLPYTPLKRDSVRYYIITIIVTMIGSLVTVSIVLGLLALVSSDGNLNPFTHLFFLPLVTVIYSLVGILILAKHESHTIGWLLLLVGITSALTLLSGAYTQYTQYVLGNSDDTLSIIFTWLDTWIWWIPSIVPLSLVLLVFPNGDFPSKHWRLIYIITVIGLAGSILATALHPGPIPNFGLMHKNPFGIVALEAVLKSLLYISSSLVSVGVIASLASIIVRYRQATGIIRIQLKWLVYAASFVIAGMILFATVWMIVPDSPLVVETGISLTVFGVTLIIIVIGIAIVKHQLWDVDMFINRTFVYALLTMVVVAMYVITVTFLSTIFDDDNALFSLTATGLVAVSFQPLREYVQGVINNIMFGDRDEPFKILERLSKQLEPVMVIDQVLPTIVQSIADALRLPYVAIAFEHNGHYKIEASYPENTKKPNNMTLTTLNLDYQSEHIGQLLLSPRGQGDIFTQTESNLLETVARQASIVAYNVCLTTELQRSREELVTTREEERRRLRRDLHDGLGPILASMSFRLDAVRNFVDHDGDKARLITLELKEQVQSSLSEIRRIAYNLRPPALDELGLIGALQEHLVALDGLGGLQLSFDTPQQLQPLSAATEVATYRIVLEAVTNVQRHADATSCNIRLWIDTALHMEIADNGCGIVIENRSGVGISSMQERAAELGGQCRIENRAPSGTRVYAVLPLTYRI